MFVLFYFFIFPFQGDDGTLVGGGEKRLSSPGGLRIGDYAAKACRSLWRGDSLPSSWGPRQGTKQQRWLRGRQLNSEKKAGLYLRVLGGVAQTW